MRYFDGFDDGYNEGFDDGIRHERENRKITLDRALILRQHSGHFMALSLNGGFALGDTSEEAQLNFLEKLL